MNRTTRTNLLFGAVVFALAAVFAAGSAVAQNAPEDDLFDPGRFPWTDGQPFYRFIAENTYEHYADHVPDLRAMLP